MNNAAEIEPQKTKTKKQQEYLIAQKLRKETEINERKETKGHLKKLIVTVVRPILIYTGNIAEKLTETNEKITYTDHFKSVCIMSDNERNAWAVPSWSHVHVWTCVI